MFDADEFLRLVKARRTTRVRFDESRPVEPEALRLILEAAAWAPTAHNMQNFEIIAVDDPEILRRLSELEYSPSPAFVMENYSQLSFTDEEWKKKGTGFPAGWFPAPWLSPEARAGSLIQPPTKLGGAVRRGPLLLLILYDPARRAPDSEGDFLGVMSLGFMLENMWLAAAAQGLGFQIISAMGNDPMAGQIKDMLGAPPELRLVFGCRLGYPGQTEGGARRVCRDVEDMVSFNRYGN